MLAVNSLHAFFSKFPVSDVPTLAFGSIGFTYLVVYWRSAEPARQRRHLMVAALAFLCLFTTRISGFLYLPFFFLLAAATLLCDMDLARRKAIHRWLLAVVALYAASVLYGLRWSAFYSRHVYRSAFQLLFGEHWRAGLIISAVVAMLGWFAIWIASRSKTMRTTLSRKLSQMPSVIAPAFV